MIKLFGRVFIKEEDLERIAAMIALLENDIEHLQTDVKLIRKKVRELES